MFALSIRTLFRHIVRNKVTSLISVAGLAAGMACVMLVMLWVHHEWSYDRFHAHADRLYRVVFSVAADGKTMRMYFSQDRSRRNSRPAFPKCSMPRTFSGWNRSCRTVAPGFSAPAATWTPPSSGCSPSALTGRRDDGAGRSPRDRHLKGTCPEFFGDLDPVGKTLLMMTGPRFMSAGCSKMFRRRRICSLTLWCRLPPRRRR